MKKGDDEKMEPKQKANYTLPPRTIETIKILSKEKQLSMSVILQLAVEEYAKKENNTGGEQKCV